MLRRAGVTNSLHVSFYSDVVPVPAPTAQSTAEAPSPCTTWPAGEARTDTKRCMDICITFPLVPYSAQPCKLLWMATAAAAGVTAATLLQG